MAEAHKRGHENLRKYKYMVIKFIHSLLRQVVIVISFQHQPSTSFSSLDHNFSRYTVCIKTDWKNILKLNLIIKQLIIRYVIPILNSPATCGGYCEELR